MSGEEPGELAWKAYRRAGWSWWEELPRADKQIWARIEAAIRADERAKNDARAERLEVLAREYLRWDGCKGSEGYDGRKAIDARKALYAALADAPAPVREKQPSISFAAARKDAKASLNTLRETVRMRNKQRIEGATVDLLADLVTRFSDALLAKLQSAAEKYGYTDHWARDGWRDELAQELMRHVRKGDPRDVAAYCAFAWHHGWAVAPAAETPETEFKAVSGARDDAKGSLKTLNEALRKRRSKPAPVQGDGEAGWRDIESAPKDGTQILAWCVHPNDQYASDDRWRGPVIAHWINHNSGGWTWYGHLGSFTHWRPLPAAPTTDPRP